MATCRVINAGAVEGRSSRFIRANYTNLPGIGEILSYSPTYASSVLTDSKIQGHRESKIEDGSEDSDFDSDSFSDLWATDLAFDTDEGDGWSEKVGFMDRSTVCEDDEDDEEYIYTPFEGRTPQSRAGSCSPTMRGTEYGDAPEVPTMDHNVYVNRTARPARSPSRRDTLHP